MTLRAFLFLRCKIAKTPNGSLRRLVDLIAQATSGKGPLALKSFGVMSPDRSERSPQENAVKQAELKDLLRKAGYGFIRQIGFWRETVPGFDALVPVRETSYFIPGIPLRLLREIAAHFGQEGVVYGGSDTNYKVLVVGKGGSFEIGDLKTLTNAPRAEVDSYDNRSEVKGRPYVFASVPPLLRPGGR